MAKKFDNKTTVKKRSDRRLQRRSKKGMFSGVDVKSVRDARGQLKARTQVCERCAERYEEKDPPLNTWSKVFCDDCGRELPKGTMVTPVSHYEVLKKRRIN